MYLLNSSSLICHLRKGSVSLQIFCHWCKWGVKGPCSSCANVSWFPYVSLYLIFFKKFPFSLVWMYHGTPFCPQSFCVKESAENRMSFPLYVASCFSLLLLLILFNFCHYNYSKSWWDLFGFILFGAVCTSWTWMSISFPQVRGSFQLVFFLKRPLPLSRLLLGPL